MICDMDLKAKKNACKGFWILVRYNKPAKDLNATEINLVLLFKKTDTRLLHEYIHFRQPPEILARHRYDDVHGNLSPQDNTVQLDISERVSTSASG